jgi:hypothetical protein
VTKNLRRSIAATAAGAVVAAGSLAFTAPSAVSAAQDAPRPVRTMFGYAAYSFGSQLVVDGIEPLSARRGFAEIKCTQFSGRQTGASVLPAEVEELLPPQVRDILDLGVLKTSNDTFTTAGGKVHGTRGIASLARLSVGGQVVDGLELPRLTIKSLSSTAIARHTAGKGYESLKRFSLGDIAIEVPEGSPVAGTPLEDLLEVIDEVTAGTAVLDDVVNELLALTGEFGVIEIPNLGSIALRGRGGRATRSGATSEAYTLDLKIDPDGAEGKDWAPARLKLGRAFARIGGPVRGGVFRSHSVPFKLSVLNNEMLTFQTAGTQAMPCQGTPGGKVRTHRFPNGRIGSALGLITVTDAVAQFSGRHVKTGRILNGRRTNRPWHTSMMRTTVGEVAVPLAGVSIKNLVTAVAVNTRKPVMRRGRQTMIRSITRKVDEVILGDVAHELPAVGEVIEFTFDGGTGYLEGLRLGNGYFGRSVKPLKLTLLSDATEDVLQMVIGEANANVMPNG